MKSALFMPSRLSLAVHLFSRLYFVSWMMQSWIALVQVKYSVRCKTIYIFGENKWFTSPRFTIYISTSCRRIAKLRKINVWSPSSLRLSVLISVVADPKVLWKHKVQSRINWKAELMHRGVRIMWKNTRLLSSVISLVRCTWQINITCRCWLTIPLFISYKKIVYPTEAEY